MTKIKLDLACGNNLQNGYTGVDIVGKPESQADIVHNLLKFPWPIEDNSVDEVFCAHYLEHIPHTTEEINQPGFDDPLFHFMDEVYRILKPGGIAKFITPYYTSVRAYQDPTHLRVITEPTYNYFNKEWRNVLNNLQHYPIRCDFDIIKLDHAISPEMQGKSNDAVSYMAMHDWNIIMDLLVTLKKPKKSR